MSLQSPTQLRTVDPRPASECRITRIRYVGLGVANLDSSLGYHRDLWGLTLAESERGMAFLSAEGSTDPYTLRLRAAEQNRLDVVSFGVPTREDVDWYAARLARRGVHMISEPAALNEPGGAYGFRFFDPVEGRTLEIAADWREKVAREIAEGEHVPVGLSHVVLNSARVPELVEFFSSALGFFQSDYLEDLLVFLKGATPSHHMFAVGANEYPNLNHIAYETRGLDEYMRAAGTMMRAGFPMVWGPGRHGPGNNVFAYFEDPNGFVSEYTGALETIDDVSTWRPRIWPTTPELSDVWGTACVRDPRPFIGVPDESGWNAPPI